MSGIKHDSYEHILMCLICRSLFDDYDHQPKFLPCHHTFCKECLKEYVRQVGEEIECPSCKKIATIPAAGISALQTNFYVRYIRSLVYSGGALGQGGNVGPGKPCIQHPEHLLQFYCEECSKASCEMCKIKGECINHVHRMLTCTIEQYQARLDSSFIRANDLIEKQKIQLEDLMKKLAEDKDRALLRIESTFESHVHALNRRATLLKNKVIDIYNDRVTKLESDMEEISTATTCIVSLKEFHETSLSKGDLFDVNKGILELEEIYGNIQSHIQPQASHVTFDDTYSLDRYRSCIKDLGRVTCQSNPPLIISPTTPESTPIHIINNRGDTSINDSPIQGLPSMNLEGTIGDCNEMTLIGDNYESNGNVSIKIINNGKLNDRGQKVIDDSVGMNKGININSVKNSVIIDTS